MQLFYHPDIAENDAQITFSQEESKHLIKVLRKKTQDQIFVTNGKGLLFKAEITEAQQKKCVAKILSTEKESPKSYQLHLAVAPTKMNDRYEWFLEKATEIGITSITPIICDHSERKVVKLPRFEKVLQSAMKQSLQFTLPQLNDPVSFSEFIQHEQKGELLIAHCEEDKKQLLKELLQPNTSYTVLIGPEGDFSSAEIKQALLKGFVPVSLGNTRLRTETAAIVATHSLAFVNEKA